MDLNANNLKEILKAPRNKNFISKAVQLEKRLRFHTETNISRNDISEPTTTFLTWVSGLIPKDKFNVFIHLFSFPLPTPAIVEDVYRELERVFYSRNSSASYRFTSSDLVDDWNNYRLTKLSAQTIWKTEGWQKMKVAINSILIVDMPEQQTTEKPEPYFYWLAIDQVIDFESADGNNIDWIVFKQGKDKIAAFDNTHMRLYAINEKNELGALLKEAKHGLTACPARFFWSTALTENQVGLKKNSITKELSNLDWLLFYSLSKRHLDLYASYPIYSAYEAECDYENNETGEYCDGGFLRNDSGNYKIVGGIVDKCPVCSEKRIAGPGSFIEVPIPKEGNPDLRNPIQITSIDAESLTYNVKEVQRLKNDIIVSCVGSGGQVSEKEAINTDQVVANFESKTSVLNALKTNFENAQKFIEETICKLRYGSDFVSMSLSWGTEFYVFTIDELYEKYKTAKANGASDAELDALSNQILETEYRNNPVQLQRMQILRQIEPFRHYTTTEVLTLLEKGLVDEKQVKLKINFSYYIDKFERENINIVEFASKLPFRQKIDKLTTKLYDYVETTETTSNNQRGASGEGTASGAPDNRTGSTQS